MSTAPEPEPEDEPELPVSRWTDNPLSSAGHRLPDEQYLAQSMAVVGLDGVERRGTMADYLAGKLHGP